MVNPFQRISLHSQQEAGTHLGLSGTRPKECWGCMGKPLFAHESVGFKGCLKILIVNTDGYSHEHRLRSFNHLPLHLRQVQPLQGLKPKEIILIVKLVVYNLLDLLNVCLNNVVELLIDQGHLSPFYKF